MELAVLRDSIANKWGYGNEYVLQKRIEYSIIAARATIIQRRYDSTKIFPQSLIERVRCVDLIIVDEDECSCGCAGGRQKVIRTANKVPKPLIVKDDSYFMFVGRGTTSFSYVPFHQIEEIPNRRFSDKLVFYSYSNDYIYIIGAPIKALDLSYVPENLFHFLKFGQCSDSDCIRAEKIHIEDSLIEGIEALLESRKPVTAGDKPDSEVTIDD